MIIKSAKDPLVLPGRLEKLRKVFLMRLIRLYR